ncbi:hypothetical protein NXX18_20655, partial [Bacteroides fragilis]|nr:hypothetical protein [Bacteroides fragilis]
MEPIDTITLTSEAQKVIVGHNDLKVEGGLTNFRQKWKFIDLNLTLTYSLGGKAVDYATWLHD